MKLLSRLLFHAKKLVLKIKEGYMALSTNKKILCVTSVFILLMMNYFLFSLTYTYYKDTGRIRGIGDLVFFPAKKIGQRIVWIIKPPFEENLPPEEKSTSEENLPPEDDAIADIVKFIDGIITQQEKLRYELNEMYYNHNYTIDNPLIVSNPFHTTPYNAVIKFKTEDRKKFKVRIQPINNNYNTISYSPEKVATTEHEIDIIGMVPGYTNTVVLIDIDTETEYTLHIKQPEIPYPLIENIAQFLYDVEVYNSVADSDAELFLHADTTVPFLYDKRGNIRWAFFVKDISSGIGNYVFQDYFYFSVKGKFFLKTSLNGIITRRFYDPPMPNLVLHHDYYVIPSEGLFYLSHQGSTYSQKPNTSFYEYPDTLEDTVIRFDFKSNKAEIFMNLFDLLQPDRLNYNHYYHSIFVADSIHLNSLDFYDNNAKILLSARNQSAVISLDTSSKEINWILSDPYGWNEDFQKLLLKPVGKKFQYPYGQHDAKMIDGKYLMIYNNNSGNFHPNPLMDNNPNQLYTEVLLYLVDEPNKEVRLLERFGGDLNLYSSIAGGYEFSQNKILYITFSHVVKNNSNNVNLISSPRESPSNKIVTNRSSYIVGLDQKKNVVYKVKITHASVPSETRVIYRSVLVNLNVFFGNTQFDFDGKYIEDYIR